MSKAKTPQKRAPDDNGIFEYSIGCPPGWSLEAVSFVKELGNYELTLNQYHGPWKASLTTGSITVKESSYQTSANKAMEVLKKALTDTTKEEMIDLCKQF